MFTGIIEELGTLRRIEPLGQSIRLEIACEQVRQDARRGDSIAVDGVCLTAEELPATGFTAFASPETMAKTTLGARRIGDRLNLERALTLSTRLGGHLVSGHVDATGRFLSANRKDGSWEVRIAAPPEIMRLCVPKGSIAVDGISLTLVDVQPDQFSLWIIPETWERTTLSLRQPGDPVNLESDLIGKYVARLLEGSWLARESSDANLASLLGKGGWGSR
jgi:riboflavin synthase